MPFFVEFVILSIAYAVQKKWKGKVVQDFINVVVFNIFPLLFAIIFHEISHGVVAYALGDDTAKRAGRFRLFTHFDLWGSFLIPLGLYLMRAPFLMGYAKPVPVDPRKFKDPLADMALVAIAGPLYNLFVGVICCAALKTTAVDTFAFKMLLSFTFVNFGLFFFNLIPIPPLDGSRIIAAVIPKKFVSTYYTLEPFGFLIIVGLEMLSGPLSQLFGCRVGLFYTFIERPIRGIMTTMLS